MKFYKQQRPCRVINVFRLENATGPWVKSWLESLVVSDSSHSENVQLMQKQQKERIESVLSPFGSD